MDSTEAIDGSSLPVDQSGTGTGTEQSSVSFSYLVDNSTDSLGSVQKIQSGSALSSSPLPQSQVGDANLAVFIPASGESQSASATVAKPDDPGEMETLHLPLSSSQKLGAWAKPLSITSDQSAVTVLMQTTKNLLADLSSESQWPTLSAAAHSNQRRHQIASSGTMKPPTPKGNDAPACFQNSLEQVREYPWAAKMDKTKRNLHQVTTPVFLEDGTPKVRIPRHVLLEGLENQKEFVLGQFYRCSAPPSGLIQSVVSRIWGTKCRIYTRQLGESSFLFHIPDEPTRKWVTQRGIWHVDDCLLFVSSWNPVGTLSLPEITTIPVWLTLKNIPHQLYSKKGISWIASGIGAPMLTSRPWLDPILMGEAKILVEVKLDRPFPQRVALEDEDGSISMVTVIYSWLPSKCTKCGQLGHKATRCLGLPPVPAPKAPRTTETSQTRSLSVSNVTGSTLQQVSAVPTPPIEAPKPPHAITFDSQGCILLDQESNDLTQSNMPITTTEATVKHTEVIVTNLQGPSDSRETETVPHVNSLEDNSTSIIFPSSVVECLPETAPLSPVSGFTQTYTSSTSASPTVFVPLDFTSAGKPSFPTSVGEKNCESVDGIQDASKKLSEVKGSNRFANLASMEEEVAPEDVSSPAHSPVPTVVNNPASIFNFSSPASQVRISDFGDPLATSSQGPTAATDTDSEGGTSSYSYDMAQRSRGGRCLKPSQKLKDMEWFTVTRKRGRGRATLGRGSH